MAQSSVSVVPDRPGFGDGSAIVAGGHIQVEAGYGFSDFGPARQHDFGQLLVRYGISERVELRGLLNSYSVLDNGDDEQGLQDLALGAKVNLVAGDGAVLGTPNVTLIATAGLPTGNEAFTNDAVVTEVKLAADGVLAERLGIGANLGYSINVDDTDRNLVIAYVALGTTLPNQPDLGFFAGFYSLFPQEGDSTTGVDGGLTWLLNPQTQLDVNLGTGLGDNALDVAFGVGIAHIF